MCLFPDYRLLTKPLSRGVKARLALKDAKIENPTANDIVRLLGLTKENQYDKSASFSNPLWKMPYDDQLRFKENSASKQLRRLAEIVQETMILPIVDERTGFFRSMTFSPIVPSPKLIGYRSKDSYVVNLGVDGDPATVGIPYGSPPLLVSIPPSETHVIAKPIHRLVAKLFQNYLRDFNTPVEFLPTPNSDGGGYRNIVMRSSRLEDKIMVIVQLNGKGIKKPALDLEKRRLADYFLNRSFGELPSTSKIASLYFQRSFKDFCHSEEAPYEHLGGDETIEEKILGRTFGVSAESFFQINVDCAEVLFRTVLEQCSLNRENTILLDLGCGAGVYSIVLADHVKRAVGVDLNPHCIRDAEMNARSNGIENTKFVHGRLETTPREIFDRMTRSDENLVAVVNPGRWGLMAETVMALRRLSTLKRLIYVSCYPYETAFANFVNLLRQPTDQYVGEPFRLSKAIPVDMFPQTPHYELVLLFER